MKGITKGTTRNNYYGTDVDNASDYFIPEDVLQVAAKLRQLMLDYKLPIKMTVEVFTDELE